MPGFSLVPFKLFWAVGLVAVLVPLTTTAQTVSVTGGNLVLTISTGAAGSQPVGVVNATASLDYRRGTVVTKITVATSCPGQRFNLSVVAVSPETGTAAPSTSLVHNQPATDFITDIPPKPPNKSYTSTLQYTASATYAQGNSAELGNDVHTVTYTILAQ